LDTPRVEERAGADEEGVGSLAINDFEGGIDLAASIRVQHLDLQSHGGSCRVHVSQRDLGQRSKGWIDQHGHTSRCGYQLAQKFEPLCCQFAPEPIDACQIAARPGKAGDKTQLDRVFAADENDGDRRGCGLDRECSRSGGGDHSNTATNEIGRQRWQSIGLIVGPAIFDRDVLAIDKARLLQALVECAQLIAGRMNRCGVEEPHHRHRRLLRARHERACSCGTDEQRHEPAASHV